MCYDLQNSSHSLATQVQLMADKPICFLKDLKQELDKSYRERLERGVEQAPVDFEYVGKMEKA